MNMETDGFLKGIGFEESPGYPCLHLRKGKAHIVIIIEF